MINFYASCCFFLSKSSSPLHPIHRMTCVSINTRIMLYFILLYCRVHFWAPMSKWMISGASFFDLYRPTEQISLPQYTALTLTGFFFTPYSLLVVPINYTLCSVNIALFLSSGWHLGRKIHADYLSDEPTKQHTSSS